MKAVGHSTAGPKDLIDCRFQQGIGSKFWFWSRKVFQGSWLSILGVLTCFVIRLSLDPVLHDNLSFCLFIIPVVVATWHWGLRASVMTAGTSRSNGARLGAPITAIPLCFGTCRTTTTQLKTNK